MRDVLDGGARIVARIRRMKVDKKAMPPGLGEKIKPHQEQKKEADKDAERKFMANMKADDWADLYRAHLKVEAQTTPTIETNSENLRKQLDFGAATKKELNDWAKLFGIGVTTR